MNLEKFQNFAATNQWDVLVPELTLSLFALGLLIFDCLRPDWRRYGVHIAMAGVLLAMVVSIMNLCYGEEMSFLSLQEGDAAEKYYFSGMIRHDIVSQMVRLFFLISSLFVAYLGHLFLARRSLAKVEFYAVLLIVTAALMLVSQSNHFLMLFVALETVTIGFYVLVAYAQDSVFSLEAGLKYLILSAVSSTLLLFGMALLYGIAANATLPGVSSDPLNFDRLQPFILYNASNPYVLLGAVLVFCGIAFKIGAVPFQIWVPDVYQGAPTPVTALLAVSSKAAGFLILINLLSSAFRHLAFLTPLLSAVAIASILFGNIAALGQKNVKRLMGLSGIVHAGYLLIGIIAMRTVPWAVWAVLFYLVTYLLGAFAVFGVMALRACSCDASQSLDGYDDLSRERPFLAAVLTLGLGSLAGIPPLAGFVGKLLIFIAAYQAGLYALLIVAIIGVVLSIYYYFGWIERAVFRIWRGSAEEEKRVGAAAALPKLARSHYLVLGSIALLTVLLGFYQGDLGRLIADSQAEKLTMITTTP